MADDWNPGDLALCVNNAPLECIGCGAELTGKACPPRGSVRQVKAVIRCDEAITEEGGLSEIECAAPVLIFADSEADATRCRKIRPHSPDAEDAETIRLLNGERVPA
jgi:hypothetical protein